MPRALWKGAIAFGLVHVPVGIYPASKDDAIDFDWLDKRSMDPVGYKRINKRTGREIDKDDIVKGIKQPDDQYIVLSDAEIKAAYPTTTQTIEIDAFVSADAIPFVYLDKPYYLAPVAKGEKVYALLRETLLATQRIGVARVVIQTKQHLAALIPVGPALMLNTLRWPSEIRPWNELELPAEGSKAASLSERELQMARQLVDDMTAEWDPSQYHSTFKDSVMALVDRKLEAGEAQTVEPLEPTPDAGGSNVVDLTQLLQRSLARQTHGATGRTGNAALAADRAASNTAAKDTDAGAASGKPVKRAARKSSKPAASPAAKAASKPACKRA